MRRAVVSIVLLVGGCSDAPVATVPLSESPVTRVVVDPPSATLYVGATLRLSAVATRGNVLAGRTIAWTTSAPAVATVDTSGLVRAIDVGSATITATSEGVSDSSHVSVLPLEGRIAFLSDHDGSVQVYVMNADGSDVRQLTRGADLGVSDDPISPVARLKWSPDGTRLAVAGPGITVIDASDGSDRTIVSRDGVYPAWARDGSILRFLVEGVYAAYDVLPDGSDTIATTLMVPDSGGQVRKQLDWAPDLSRMAFARSEAIPGYLVTWVFVANADGSNRRALDPDSGAHGAPAWSPDGSRIAFWSCEWGIAMIGSSGVGVTPLAPDLCQSVPNVPGIWTTLGWSPDGKHLAFMRDTSIWVLDVGDPESPRWVGPEGYDAWAPAWGP